MARKSRKNAVAPIAEATPIAKVYNAAAYIRLSVEDNKKKGDSVETQKAILENFIALAPEIKLHDFYIDNGISGSTFERESFKRMLADAESGVINCIIVKDLSRFGRSAIDTGYYIEKYLPSLDCRFVAVNDDFDSNDDTNNGVGVILPLKNIINEAYALDIGRKVKSQLHQAMKAGEYIGPTAPYGYFKAPDNCHKLIVDPVASDIVKRIFEMFAEGGSVVSIVRYLNEAKIPTPAIYQREIGLTSGNKPVGNGSWQSLTINRILKNEIYTGDMVQGKTKTISRKDTPVDKSEWIRVPNTHEAVISRELFTKIQERLERMADKAAKKNNNPFTPNIFKGKIFCGHCGDNLQRTRGWMRKDERVYVFTCISNRQKARGSCMTFHLPEEDLIQTLLTMIQVQADTVIGKSLKLRNNSAKIEAKREAIKAEIVTLRQEANKNGRMAKSLYESLVNGIITSDEYREMRESYETKMQNSLIKAKELENQQRELEKQLSEYFELSGLLADTNNSGITAKIIDCLIDKITVFADRRIEVDFSFSNNFEMISEVADCE